MWCIWKFRNDFSFDRKKSEPYQINISVQAIHNNMELFDVSDVSLQNQGNTIEATTKAAIPPQGNTLKSDLLM
jgi:hypothetical protein